MIIIRCSGIFRDVPGCSGMFHVPDFIDGHFIHEDCSYNVERKIFVHVLYHYVVISPKRHHDVMLLHELYLIFGTVPACDISKLFKQQLLKQVVLEGVKISKISRYRDVMIL